MSNQSLGLADERAERIRRVRKFLGFSRKKLADKYSKYELTASALQSWEDVRHNGLTEAGAAKLIKAYQDEGLTVDLQWLLYGAGPDPIPDAMNLLRSNAAKPSEKELIAKELRFFHENNPGSIDMIVNDGSMAPLLSPGDYVAGRRFFENEFYIAKDKLCILQTVTGQMLIKVLEEKDIQESKILSVAPILWVRKQS